MSDPDWINPEYTALGALLRSRGLASPDPATAEIAEVRAMAERVSAFLLEGAVPLARERDLALPGPHGAVPCRLYLPDGGERPPLIVYAHGGSFALGSVAGWHGVMRELVRESGVAALSVDYRLAPEHRFPVAFEEMVAMLRLAAREGADLGIDPTRLAAGGDSAGANLALGAALALRDARERSLSFLLLHYGAYSSACDSPSWQRFGTGAYVLSQAQFAWLWETYLERPEQRQDWRAAPLEAELAGLPPALLTIGTLDPLWDDNQRLAQRLDAAGVRCQLRLYEGLPHGFIRAFRHIATVRRALSDSAAALRRALIDEKR